MNYHNRKFKAIANSDNGEVSNDMIFHYQQMGNVLTCSYKGEKIIEGHLIGLVDASGSIQMSYHQINTSGNLMSGVCTSTPKRMSNEKIRLYEEWQWTSGDYSKGTSILEEI